MMKIVGVCVSNPDRSPVGINRRDTAPTSTGFAEIVSDDFPVLHVATPHAELSLDPYYFCLSSAKYFICFVPSLLLSSGLSSINSLATTV
jgi:hypothetical protein